MSHFGTVPTEGTSILVFVQILEEICIVLLNVYSVITGVATSHI